jgi:hypothetical protein
MPYNTQNESLADFEADVYTADEEVASTNWMFDRHGILHNFHVSNRSIIISTGTLLPGFHKRCTIKANMSKLQGKLPSRFGPTGRMYYYLDFEVAIKFGARSPEARILWKEDVRCHYLRCAALMICIRFCRARWSLVKRLSSLLC